MLIPLAVHVIYYRGAHDVEAGVKKCLIDYRQVNIQAMNLKQEDVWSNQSSNSSDTPGYKRGYFGGSCHGDWLIHEESRGQ